MYSRRDVERAIISRRTQASLGFPSDSKFISALRAGTLLNCGVVPEDVHKATNIWGVDSASLKGRTTKSKPLTAAAVPLARRRFEQGW